jgi:L-asparaginase
MGQQMDGPVAVFSLGGTIAMTSDRRSGMAALTLDAADLVAAVPGLADTGIAVEAHQFRQLPGASLGFADLVELVRAAGSRVDAGAAGVVVTQGTDTIEETAFALDLLWAHDAPLVVTGAMRNPSMAGADGPANLLAAILTAAQQHTRAMGCLVVLNDEIHAARWVRKTHTTSPAAFASPDSGPVGRLIEGRAHVFHRPDRLRVSIGGRLSLADVRTAVVPMVLGDDGELLRRTGEGFDGIVVAGFGVGHVPATTVEVLTDLAGRIPVVLASRVGVGPVLTAAYGFAGSESDLRQRGLIGAATLDPFKARILLHLLLAADTNLDDIAVAFTRDFVGQSR